MSDAPIVKTSATIVNKRLRLLRQDNMITGGTIALFDTKTELKPGAGNNFSGMIEGVSGREILYSPGSTSTPTFSDGLVQWPSTVVGTPGFKLASYNDAGIDLSTRGATRIYALGLWMRALDASSAFEENLLYLGQPGVNRNTSPQAHLAIVYANGPVAGSNSVRMTVAGQTISGIDAAIALNEATFLVAIVDINPARKTRVTILKGTRAVAPAIIGVFDLTYVAFQALTAGGLILGNYPSHVPSGVVQCAGDGFGRFWLEDCTDSEVDPAEWARYCWEQNRLRFGT